jgi:hypothetical protein
MSKETLVDLLENNRDVDRSVMIESSEPACIVLANQNG